ADELAADLVVAALHRARVTRRLEEVEHDPHPLALRPRRDVAGDGHRRHRRLGLAVGHAPAVLRVLRAVLELAETFLAHPVAGDVVDALLVGAPAEPLAEVGGVTRDRVGDLPPDGLELLALARVHAQPYHDAEHALGPGHRAG